MGGVLERNPGQGRYLWPGGPFIAWSETCVRLDGHLMGPSDVDQLIVMLTEARDGHLELTRDTDKPAPVCSVADHRIGKDARGWFITCEYHGEVSSGLLDRSETKAVSIDHAGTPLGKS